MTTLAMNAHRLLYVPVTDRDGWTKVELKYVKICTFHFACKVVVIS